MVSVSSPSATARVESADGAAAELERDRLEQLAVDPLEALRVDLVKLECLPSDVGRDRALVPHLGDVPDAPEDPVGDPRRAARTRGDLVGSVVGDLDAEDPGRASHDRRQLPGVVVAEAKRHSEAVAEWCRQEPGARRRPDERERRQVERQRARRGALAEDDVEPEVLERGVQDLLGGAVETVDLVHEQDVARLERRQDRGDVLLLERRACDGPETDSELLADDLGQRRLPEAGRPGEQDVVERVVAAPRCLERDPELLLDPFLTDEVVEALGPKRALTSSSSGLSAGARNWLMPALRSASSHALLGRQARIDICERALGIDDGVAELDERVACDEVAGRVGDGREIASDTEPSFSRSSSDDPLRRLLPDAGDRLEARVIAERDRLAKLAGRRPRHDGEGDLRADTAHREQVDEELALLGVGESVELQRVLADVQVRLDRELATLRLARRRTDGVAATR